MSNTTARLGFQFNWRLKAMQKAAPIFAVAGLFMTDSQIDRASAYIARWVIAGGKVTVETV